MNKYFIILVIFLLSLNQIFAEEKKDEILYLDTVVVRAKHVEENNDLSGFITVITREEIEKTASSQTDLPEILSQNVGVKINRFGGQGSFCTISIRGSTGSQVNVYLDGVPLNLASTGFVDISGIPLNNIERIEIYRSDSPAFFSSSAIGGTINIVTRDLQNKAKDELSYSYGSFGAQKIHFLLNNKWTKLSSLLLFNLTTSSGNFKFYDNNGTPYNSKDDEMVNRKNNNLNSFDLITKLNYKQNSRQIELSNYFYQKNQGVPGIDNYQSETAKFNSQRNVTQAAIIKNSEFINLKSTLYYLYALDSFEDKNGDIGIGRTDNNNKTDVIGGNILSEFLFPKNKQILSILLEGKKEFFYPEDKIAKELTNVNIKRTNYSFVLQDEILVNKNISFLPLYRYEFIENNFKGELPFMFLNKKLNDDKKYNLNSGRLGLVYLLNQNIKLKSNINKAYRVPNFTELFGLTNTINGNTELIPEENNTTDFGLEFKLEEFALIKKSSYELAYFVNNAKNLIVFEQNSQRTTIAKNVNRALSYGYEFSIHADFQLFSTDLNYTYNDTKDKSNIPYYYNKKLPGRPLHEMTGSLNVPIKNTLLYLNSNVLGENYLDRANFYKVDKRVTYDFGIKYKFKEKIKVGLEVKNIRNNQVSDIAGFPLPGRSYNANINYLF